jgi:hypothetical protein
VSDAASPRVVTTVTGVPRELAERSSPHRYIGERRVALTVRELLSWMRDLESGSRKRKRQVPAEIRGALDAAVDAGIVLDNGDVISRG